ncbi:MAG: type I-C CRISPR-associated protein Cas8c/Csd1 [Xanthobacter sp.]
MSALSALVRAYESRAREGKAPAFGFSQEKIGYLISLNEDGTPADKPIDLGNTEKKKRIVPLMAVPQPAKRTSGIAPNFLWDKTAYVLGVTAGEGKRTAQEHAAFRDLHLSQLKHTDDAGLLALRRFLEQWTPEQFETLEWPEEMKDENIAFTLESQRHSRIFIHDRPAAQQIWTQLSAAGQKSEATCLVTGERGAIARLHPAIKGVRGAQSSGASIISFNLDAFSSYGHEQGSNAPVSEHAAFAYTTMLNMFLERDSHNRVQIGDATTVFWAEAAEPGVAKMAEELGGLIMDAPPLPDADTSLDEKAVADILERLSAGQMIGRFQPVLAEGVRFYVLGLSPNASRLSVRFYVEDDFGVIAKRYAAHHDRLKLEPPPRELHPSMWRMLLETAPLRKSENIQPNLAGEWMRAILTDTPYPLTLLSSVIMRLRADHQVTALRVAILKSVLIQNFGVEAPVSLDLTCKDPGYVLGRLFATYEQIQVAALGTKVNATIRDKFYGSASAQPRKVFRIIDANAVNHLSKIGKQSPGRRVNLEKQIGAIMELMSPAEDPYPASLPERSQALFALGYYHQRNEAFRKHDTPETTGETEAGEAE